jgi:hypothetical protein
MASRKLSFLGLRFNLLKMACTAIKAVPHHIHVVKITRPASLSVDKRKKDRRQAYDGWRLPKEALYTVQYNVLV